jgi:hypothetical protein
MLLPTKDIRENWRREEKINKLQSELSSPRIFITLLRLSYQSPGSAALPVIL